MDRSNNRAGRGGITDWSLAERLLDAVEVKFGLTAREREVAALVLKGHTNREIAAQLVITQGTTANHVQHLFAKLGCHNRAQLIAAVFQSSCASASRDGVTRDEPPHGLIRDVRRLRSS